MLYAARRGVMSQKSEADPMAELEKTNEKLRESIEESKELADKARALIQKARDQADIG